MLVKALPHPSTKHGETVCCAGITDRGEWKRLFPVRFRHLHGDNSFNRWDRVEFRHVPPPSDPRPESCRVFEDTIKVVGSMPNSERSRVLNPLVKSSIEAAANAGHSLALIRPSNTKFCYKTKSPARVVAEKAAYQWAAAQHSLLDKDLVALQPTPYEFKFRFSDATGSHEFTDGSWEAHAMFFNGRRRFGSDSETLGWMEQTFNDEYPSRGMLFAVGNQVKYPKTWQLLGVLRVDPATQGFLAL